MWLRMNFNKLQLLFLCYSYNKLFIYGELYIVRLLLRRINRIFQIVSYSFSTSNIHSSITKTEQSRISIIINQDIGVRALEILHSRRSYVHNVCRRFIKLSTFSICMTPFTESSNYSYSEGIFRGGRITAIYLRLSVRLSVTDRSR